MTINTSKSLQRFFHILLILLMGIGIITFTSCSGDDSDDDYYGFDFSSSSDAFSSSITQSSSSGDISSSSSDTIGDSSSSDDPGDSSSSDDSSSSSEEESQSSSSSDVSSSSSDTIGDSSSSDDSSSSSEEESQSSSSSDVSSSSLGTPSSSSSDDLSSSSISTILCIGNSLTVGYGAGAGDPPIDKNKSYPAYLEKKVNIPVVNLGVSGITAEEAALSIVAGIHDQDISEAKIIVIELGANDFLDRVQAKVNVLDLTPINSSFVGNSVEKSMEEILEHIRSKNQSVKIYVAKFYNEDVMNDLAALEISIPPLFPGMPQIPINVGEILGIVDVHNAYEDMFAYLKQSYDVEIIDDIWKDVWGNNSLMHPDIEIGGVSFGIHANAAGYEIMANNYFEAMKSFLIANSLVK